MDRFNLNIMRPFYALRESVNLSTSLHNTKLKIK